MTNNCQLIQVKSCFSVALPPPFYGVKQLVVSSEQTPTSCIQTAFSCSKTTCLQGSILAKLLKISKYSIWIFQHRMIRRITTGFLTLNTHVVNRTG